MSNPSQKVVIVSVSASLCADALMMKPTKGCFARHNTNAIGSVGDLEDLTMDFPRAPKNTINIDLQSVSSTNSSAKLSLNSKVYIDNTKSNSNPPTSCSSEIDKPEKQQKTINTDKLQKKLRSHINKGRLQRKLSKKQQKEPENQWKEKYASLLKKTKKEVKKPTQEEERKINEDYSFDSSSAFDSKSSDKLMCVEDDVKNEDKLGRIAREEGMIKAVEECINMAIRISMPKSKFSVSEVEEVVARFCEKGEALLKEGGDKRRSIDECSAKEVKELLKSLFVEHRQRMSTIRNSFIRISLQGGDNNNSTLQNFRNRVEEMMAEDDIQVGPQGYDNSTFDKVLETLCIVVDGVAQLIEFLE